MISWNGLLRVTPSSDSWIEILNLPKVIVNRTETTTINRWVSFPGGPAVTENRQTTTSMPITTIPFVRG
jgi:hypothetical protein